MAIFAAIVALTLGGGALYQAVGARRSARLYPPPGVLMEVAGQRVHVGCAGTGTPPVLFEAGIAASALSWTRIMHDVSGFTRACAYDRAGLGWSDPARSERTVDAMIAELRGVITSIAGPERPILVGHSFGAFLLPAYAARYPEDVGGLVLPD